MLLRSSPPTPSGLLVLTRRESIDLCLSLIALYSTDTCWVVISIYSVKSILSGNIVILTPAATAVSISSVIRKYSSSPNAPSLSRMSSKVPSPFALVGISAVCLSFNALGLPAAFLSSPKGSKSLSVSIIEAMFHPPIAPFICAPAL